MIMSGFGSRHQFTVTRRHCIKALLVHANTGPLEREPDLVSGTINQLASMEGCHSMPWGWIRIVIHRIVHRLRTCPINKRRYSDFQLIDYASVTVAIGQGSDSRDNSPNF